MQSVSLKTRTGPDGTLTLNVPTLLRETTMDVTVVFNPIDTNPRDLGWPEGFFEETAGAWHGDLVRGDQGQYEIRASYD